MLLAIAKERVGDLEAAVTAMQHALKLAPYYADAHWRAGNLFLRADKLEQSLTEFQLATLSDPSRTNQIFELVWEATEEKVKLINQIAQSNSTIKIAAAQFLLSKSHTVEALQLFNQADEKTRHTSDQTLPFLNALIAAGQLSPARDLWLAVLATEPGKGALSNGSFEYPVSERLNQFDWQFMPSRYAVFGISEDRARTGHHSLKVAFSGEDTTQLSNNIQQLIVVRPGVKYRLEAYALTMNLKSSEGVAMVVTRLHSSVPLASSAPVKTLGESWQQLSLEFLAPSNATGLKIEIQRLPKFSYDDPTTGTIWFDDFTLKEI